MMRLFALGPDGQPTGDAYVMDGPAVVTWAEEIQDDLEPVFMTIAQNLVMHYVLVLTEAQEYRIVELLWGRAAAQQYREDRAAVAAWEGEGGSYV